MNNIARIFNCARCWCQTIICTHCDRGNIYCGSICARESRTKNHRISNQIYQKTFRGKQKHALRQSHYRQRQKEKAKKVTDMGSANTPLHDLLPTATNENKKTISEKMHCHFCGKNVSRYLRNDYLGYYARYQKNKFIHLNDTG